MHWSAQQQVTDSASVAFKLLKSGAMTVAKPPTSGVHSLSNVQMIHLVLTSRIAKSCDSCGGPKLVSVLTPKVRHDSDSVVSERPQS